MDADRLDPVRFWVLAGMLACWAAVGCSDSAPPASGPTTQPQPDSTIQRETWDILSLKGARVGYIHQTVRHVSCSGRKAIEIKSVGYLDVMRGDQRSRQQSETVSIVSPGGELLEFRAELPLGQPPTQIAGRVVADTLQVEKTTLGKKSRTSIPWSAAYGGPFAIERSLWRKPMAPGEQRTVRGLLLGDSQLLSAAMTAEDYELVELPVGSQELLRIDCTLQVGTGAVIKEAVWADRKGDVLRTQIGAGGIETARATEALALQEPETMDLDLLWDLVVEVDRSLPDAHRTQRACYRVRLAEGDPAEAFVAGDSQQVESIDAHTAELTVYALRPGRPGGNPDAPDDPPTDDDRRPNNLIQSDNPRIVAMAEEIAPGQEDPWQVARALEQYVDRYITEVGFAQVFATAAEVAQSREGDCTEHAVLLAALARARGSPARVAMGLVYMPPQQSFGYHMWNEVYVDGRWIALDATLGLGGIGAAHLKLVHSSFDDASAFSSFLSVIPVIGQLEIEVLEVE